VSMWFCWAIIPDADVHNARIIRADPPFSAAPCRWRRVLSLDGSPQSVGDPAASPMGIGVRPIAIS
jgi:hypothetical protein